MPRLRSHSRPLVHCAYAPCMMVFRKWRGRRFCSDNCRKQEWRSRHQPYYARLKQAWLDKQKQARRQARRFAWVQEGAEDQVPERLAIEESLAQASPETIQEIHQLLGRDQATGCDSPPASRRPPAG